MLTQSQIKELFKNYKIKPQKRFGQNFLIDKNINRKILEEIAPTEDDIIIEIGAGCGNLTESLAKQARKIYAVEIDRGIVRILKDNLKDFKNVIIIEGDFLKVDLNDIIKKEKKCAKKIKVIGNLPYYISSPIIFHLLEYRNDIDFALIMVQKEVGLRLVAQAHSKDYGILSCLINFYAQTKIIRYIGKNSFYPRPKVDSALIRLNFLNEPAFKVKDENVFIDVVKGAFSKRRKNILNALSSYNKLNLDKAKLALILKGLEIDPKERAEDTEPCNFARIANSISNIR